MLVSLDKRHLKITTILIDIFLVVFVNASMNPLQKISVLESDDVPGFLRIDKKPNLNAAPTALVGFLEMHFDIDGKYKGSNDGTLCTESIPCFDNTPPEVSDSVERIYLGVLNKLGDRYDSENFYRIFFMNEEGSYDASYNPEVKLDDVPG
jgi:hypothetical protein